MAEPSVFISRWRIREGKRAALEPMFAQALGFIGSTNRGPVQMRLGTAYRMLVEPSHASQPGSDSPTWDAWDTWDSSHKGSDKGSGGRPDA